MTWLRMVTLTAALLSVGANVYMGLVFRPTMVALGAAQERARWVSVLTHGGTIDLPGGAVIEIESCAERAL